MKEKLQIRLRNSYSCLQEYIDDVTEQAFEQGRVLDHVERFSKSNHRFTRSWVTSDIDSYVKENINLVLDSYNDLLEYDLMRFEGLNVDQSLYDAQGKLAVNPDQDVIDNCIRVAHGLTIQKIMGDLGLGTTYIERESFNPGSPHFNIVL